MGLPFPISHCSWGASTTHLASRQHPCNGNLVGRSQVLVSLCLLKCHPVGPQIETRPLPSQPEQVWLRTAGRIGDIGPGWRKPGVSWVVQFLHLVSGPYNHTFLCPLQESTRNFGKNKEKHQSAFTHIKLFLALPHKWKRGGKIYTYYIHLHTFIYYIFVIYITAQHFRVGFWSQPLGFKCQLDH